MDANGLRFWMLAEETHWRHRVNVQYDDTKKLLRLAERRPARQIEASPELLGIAESRLTRIPQTRDEFGHRAWWDTTAQAIVATGAGEGTVPIGFPAVDSPPTDLVIGYDDILYVAVQGTLILYDRRHRTPPVTIEEPGMIAWRLAADPRGGIWILDRTNRTLWRLYPLSLLRRPFGDYAPSTFRPCDETTRSPALSVVAENVWSAGNDPIAVASSPHGRVGVLSWLFDGMAQLRVWPENGQPFEPVRLDSVRFPFSLAWVSEHRLAVLMPGISEALTYDIDSKEAVLPITGDIYPLRDHDGGPFLHTLGAPPYYPTLTGSTPLHPVSLPNFSSSGSAQHWIPTASGDELEAWMPLDSGESATEWHRLYVEASIPEHCGLIIWLATTNDAVPPAEGAWHEHRFGQGIPTPPTTHEVPRGVWVSQSSEIPFHPGMLNCAPEHGRAGLFTVLIQRSGTRVRALRGRYLWIRVELFGDGRTTPSLAAIRAYGSRFSYVDHYLPELYRESVFSPDADRSGTATPADFLERFTLNFEGVLTVLEDRIAHTHILTHPSSTPDESLDWLGSWIGMTFHPALSSEHRRRWLQSAPHLYEARGTLNGLRLALELISGGGITRGEIVVIELFRLRRTFATILGADLADERDPLLGGLVVSGNSFVGDTLFLGEEEQAEFLALFNLEEALDDREEAAVERLFEELAFRVTILVREGIDSETFGLIRQIAVSETPAHVHVNVATASQGLLVGIEAMIGAETFVGTAPSINPVQLDKSYVGHRDVLFGAASLDPRVEGGEHSWGYAPRPVARLHAPSSVPHGESFTLEATESRAHPGHRLARYIWERKS